MQACATALQLTSVSGMYIVAAGILLMTLAIGIRIGRDWQSRVEFNSRYGHLLKKDK